MKRLLFFTFCFSCLVCFSVVGSNKNGEEAIIKTVKDTYLSWVDRDYKQWRARNKTHASIAAPVDNPLEFTQALSGGQSIGSAIQAAKNDAGKENFSDFEIRICEQQAIARFTLNGIQKSAFLEKQQGRWKMVSVADLNPGLCHPGQILTKLKDMSGLYIMDAESLQESYAWTLKDFEMSISEIDGGLRLRCQYSVETAAGEALLPVHSMDLLVNTQNSQISHLGSIQWASDLHFVHSGSSRLCKDGSLISECTFQNDDGKSFRQILQPQESGDVILEIYEFDTENQPVLMMRANLKSENQRAAHMPPAKRIMNTL